MSYFLDLSALQSIPAANLNRDDLGSPKTVPLRQRRPDPGLEPVLEARDPARCGGGAGREVARSRLVPQKVRDALTAVGWDAELATLAGAQVAASAGDKGLKTEAEGHTVSCSSCRRPVSPSSQLSARCTRTPSSRRLPRSRRRARNRYRRYRLPQSPKSYVGEPLRSASSAGCWLSSPTRMSTARLRSPTR